MVDLDIPTIPLISATYLLNKKGAINSFLCKSMITI